MRILWVKSNFLHPLDSGGTIRTYQMLRQLKKVHHITYAALSSGTDNGAEERAAEYADRVAPVPWPGVPRRNEPRFYWDAAVNLGSSMPLALARYVSPQLRNALAELDASDAFDVAVADFLFAAPHFDVVDRSAKLLFQHNVETLIWRRMQETARGPLSLYMGLQARRMHRWEGRLATAFDQVVTVSRQDADLMKEWFGISNVSAVPTGVDTEFFRPSEAPPAGSRVMFLGSLDWMPNLDAINWFLDEIWPRVLSLHPGAELDVVGRRPPGSLTDRVERTPAAHLWADVPDVRDYMWRSTVVVIPLRVGGGTRIKVYEALACGAAVVSTPVGVEGLDARAGEHLLVEAEAAPFADAVAQLLEAPARAAELGARARDFVVDHCSWQRVAEEFTSNCERAVERHASARSGE